MNINYDLLSDVSSFVDHINNVVPKYDYIVTVSQRGHNFMNLLCPRVNIISGDVLLSKYKELAHYFHEHKEFPRILIVDAIMYHGYHVYPFLRKLQELLEKELFDSSFSVENKTLFYLRFRSCICSSVYAMNTLDECIIETGFKISREYTQKLYGGKLKDLEYQIIHILKESNRVNTLYTYSFRANSLSEFLGFIDNKRSKKWKKVNWTYDNEDYTEFIRIYYNSSLNTKCVSTIRFAPYRSEDLPFVTSLTLFNDISDSELTKIFARLSHTLEKIGSVNLASNLNDKNNKVLNGQILCMLLSVLDFFDFCEDTLSKKEYEQVYNNLRINVNKISGNFGDSETIKSEMFKILTSKERLNYLRDAIHGGIKDVSISKKYDFRTNEMKKINDLVDKITYGVATKEEQDNLIHQKGDAKIKVQIMSLSEFFSELNKSFMSYEENIYGFIAAFVSAVDSGTLDLNIEGDINKINSSLCMVCSATLLSQFYYPKKLALFIPALAKLEERSWALGAEKKTKEALQLISNIKKNGHFSSSELALINDVLNQSNLEEMIYTIYSCRQGFLGWNFENLTSSDDEVYMSLQRKLIQQK